MALTLCSNHSLTLFRPSFDPGKLNPANSSGLNFRKYTPLVPIILFYWLQELIKTDRLCAEKLLEGHGASMTEQKLDSILEEHIKLRGYMRTRQTKDQVEAYYQV